MVKNGITSGAARLMAAMLMAGGLSAAAGGATAGEESVVLRRQDGVPQLVHSPSHTALHYSRALSGSEMLRRAETDARKLGFPLVKTFAVGNVAVLAGTRESVSEALESAEGIPVGHLSSVYLHGGDPHPDSMMVFTNRLLVTFSDGAPESFKASFLEQRNWRRMRETASGDVFVETDETPGVHMMKVAQALEQDEMVSSATFEYLMTSQPAAQNDSLAVNDPLFWIQWPLFNTRYNTSGGNYDEDLDAPRAWMLNQRNVREHPGLYSRGTFGSPDVVVGVFDSGTEITHEDLAANIDPRVGVDYVDAGLPLPTSGATSAHGTAVAGLIAAATNDVGIAGVAPAVKIYTVRVFAGADRSVSQATLRAALQDTALKDVDVNVHPYTLPVTILDAQLVRDIELGFLLAFESGRDGLGMPNVAAAGNFASQVQYPAHSAYCWAIGGVDSYGRHAGMTNWGATGVDFVMPTFAQSESFGYGSGSGIVTTDIMGASGLAAPNSSYPANSRGNYTSLGPNQLFPSVSSGVANTFQGSSIAAAHAGAVTALMLSDNRFDEMPPHEVSAEVIYGRGQRRSRAPRNGSYLLSQLYAHADLPNTNGHFGGPLGGARTYVDQYNEFLGHGRPNASFFSVVKDFPEAVEATEGWATPDSLFREFADEPFYEAIWGMEGTPGMEVMYNEDGGVQLDEESGNVVLSELAQGWSPYNLDPFNPNLIETPLDDGLPSQLISPYLDSVSALYFEDGTVLRPETPGNVFYVWADSMTTAPLDSEDADVGDNLVYNPTGRYHRQQVLDLISPAIALPEGYAGEPLLLTFQLAHNLGMESSTANPNDTTVSPTRAGSVQPEIDKLIVKVVVGESERTVGTITGDSTLAANQRLVTSDLVEEPADNFFIQFALVDEQPYRPYQPDNQMVIRTYSMVIPTLGDAANFNLKFELQPGDSWLPEWLYDADQEEWNQFYNIFRDEKGFLLYSVSLQKVQSHYMEYLNRENFVLSPSARFPTWSHSMRDVNYAAWVNGPVYFNTIGAAPAQPPYYSSDFQAIYNRSAQNLMFTDEIITGMKEHPYMDFLAVTATDHQTESLYLVTHDGVNLRRVVSPQFTQGARTPSWALNGNQLVYSSFDYIRILNFTTSFLAEELGVNIETVLTRESSFLEDFRSPVFDELAGVVIFVARPKDTPDASLGLYVATRTGRVMNYPSYTMCPGGPPRSSTDPFLYGWDGIDIFDLDYSPTSNRLIFSAMASQPPTPPETCEEGIVGIPALASSAAKIYTIENFDYVLRYNNRPIYMQPELLTAGVSGINVSARFPRISPDASELLWVGFSGFTNPDSLDGGVLVRQPITSEDPGLPIIIDPPDPTPTPVVPTTRPPFPNNGQVTYSGRVDFLADAEGWTFRTGGPELSVPTSGYVASSQIGPGQTEQGSLLIQANNSVNAFGYFESPKGLLQVIPGALYLVRGQFRATAGLTPGEVPITRLRVNSNNLESAFTAEVHSRGNLALSPVSGSQKAIDLLFRPPVGLFDLPIHARTYSVSYDFMNFLDNHSENNPNGGVLFDRIDLYRLDDAKLYYAMWSFYAPDAGTISLTALQPQAAEDEFSVSIRTCCTDANSDIACDAGRTTSGIALNTVPVTAGTTYTLLVATRSSSPVQLDWSSTVSLVPSNPASCSAAASSCDGSTPISGTGGSSTVTPMYAAVGSIEAPSCSVIENESVVEGVTTVYDANMGNSAAQARWTQGPNPTLVPYTNPEFLRLADGIALRVIDPANTFGYWSAAGSTIPSGNTETAEGETLVYRATFTIANDYEANPLTLPVIRVRLSTNDFQKTAEGYMAALGDGKVVPQQGRPRDLEVYLVLEDTPSGFSSFVAGFDVMSFYPSGRTVTAQPITLKRVRVEKLDVPLYPSPR